MGNFVLKFFGQKGPKMKFLKFMKNQFVVHFLLFCMGLWQHEYFKIMNLMIFYFSSEEYCTEDLLTKKCHILLILT